MNYCRSLRVRIVEKFVESAPATLGINIKYIMLSLWAIRLSTAATLNPRRNTHTHPHTLWKSLFNLWPIYMAKMALRILLLCRNISNNNNNNNKLTSFTRRERREQRLGCWSVKGGAVVCGESVCGFTALATPFGAIEFLWKPHKFRGIFNSGKPFLPLCPRLPTNLGQFIAFGQFVKCHSGEF